MLLASTINRTWLGYLFAIVGAECVFRVLPVGMHRWKQFVTPDELAHTTRAGGLLPIEIRGFRYVPVAHGAWWTAD